MTDTPKAPADFRVPAAVQSLLFTSGAVPAAPLPAREPPPPPVPANVSQRFPDLAPEYQVYETDDGYLVKVMTLWDDAPLDDPEYPGTPSAHGRERFLISGSIVGPDGKAKRRNDDTFAVHDLRRQHYHHADREEDPAIKLEAARLLCVADTVRAEKGYQQIAAYTEGLVSVSARRARKAAELAGPVR